MPNRKIKIEKEKDYNATMKKMVPSAIVREDFNLLLNGYYLLWLRNMWSGRIPAYEADQAAGNPGNK